MLKKSKKLLAALTAMLLLLAVGAMGFTASAEPVEEVTITVYYAEMGYVASAQPMFTTTIPVGESYTETAPDIAGFDFVFVSTTIDGEHYAQQEPELVLDAVTEDTRIRFYYERNSDNEWLSIMPICVSDEGLSIMGTYYFDVYELGVNEPPLYERGSSPSVTAPDIDGYEYVGYILSGYFDYNPEPDGTDQTVTIEDIQESTFFWFIYREIGQTDETTTTTTIAVGQEDPLTPDDDVVTTVTAPAAVTGDGAQVLVATLLVIGSAAFLAVTIWRKKEKAL